MDIYDIAQKSGYSIATVSRVLNNSDKVSDKAKAKILNIIEENDYTPNRVARSLAKNKTSLVGIMVPDIRKYFESQSAYELEQRLNANGYLTLLGDSTNDLTRKKAYLNLLRQNKVDAIVCVGSTYEQNDFYDEILKLSDEIPFAMVNSNPINKSKNISYVYIDEIDAMKKALSHLYQKGYKQPMFVSYEKNYATRSYIAKKAGFIEALDELYKSSDYIEFKIKDLEKDLKKLNEFLKVNSKIDSICFELDFLAIPAFKYLINQGINIPDDIGIIGFDNIDATNYASKKITSIDQNVALQADIATKSLIDLIDNKELEKNSNMIEAKLIIKETT